MKNNSFESIGTIISLIISKHFSSSVNTLSVACSIPIPQMRNYLANIFKNKLLHSHFYPAPNINEHDEDPLKTTEIFFERIAKGMADNEPIYLIDMENFTESYHLLQITSVEAGYLNNIYPELLQNQQTNLFEIKDSIESIPKWVIEKHDKVQDAISREKQIEFTYKSSKCKLIKTICSPVSVVQDLTDHLFYIKDSDDNYYRIDRIKSDIKILQQKSDIGQYQPSPFQKYFWGTEYKVHGEPVHVKLQISADTTNIITKIKNDTVLRSSTSKLYQNGKYYYYEDDILGMQDFRRWLRSYGSSITVIEPQTLINEILYGTNKTLSFYNELNSIKF